LIEENNILRFLVTNVGYNVEEVLCPITKKCSPAYDDEDIKPEEEGEDEELLNWEKKTEEVKEITPEVLVEEVTPEAPIEEITPMEESTTPEAFVQLVTPEIMAAWAKKEEEINEVEMVTPEIMAAWAKKEEEIDGVEMVTPEIMAA